MVYHKINENNVQLKNELILIYFFEKMEYINQSLTMISRDELLQCLHVFNRTNNEMNVMDNVHCESYTHLIKSLIEEPKINDNSTAKKEEIDISYPT